MICIVEIFVYIHPWAKRRILLWFLRGLKEVLKGGSVSPKIIIGFLWLHSSLTPKILKSSRYMQNIWRLCKCNIYTHASVSLYFFVFIYLYLPVLPTLTFLLPQLICNIFPPILDLGVFFNTFLHTHILCQSQFQQHRICSQ